MRRLMFPVFLLALPTTAWSCASSGSSPGTEILTPSDRVVARDNRTTYRTSVAPNAKVPIPAVPGRAVEALRAVYAELGVPPGTYDPAAGRVGNTNFYKTHKLGNEAISAYLNCGSSLEGSAADNDRIYISLISVVRPDGSGASELETAFSAQAQKMDGASSDRIACGTTGRLEERIQKGVLAKVAAGRP
jgi:hypothetical protein